MSFATVVRTARAASLSIGLRPVVSHCARLSHNHASNSDGPDTVPQNSTPLTAPEKREETRTGLDARIISYDEFLPKTQSSENERSIIIDVREPAEVAEGMIPSAIHIPLAEVVGALKLRPAEFLEKYGVQKPQSEDEVIFYCRSGRRSTLASNVAREQGYTNILNYKGSWLDWVENQNQLKA